MKKIRTITSIILVLSILLAACGEPPAKGTLSESDRVSKMRLAQTTPFGKYPECITYTLGKMTGANNSNMPNEDTYENNAYTRYLKDKLNIQNEDAFEATNDKYDDVASMAISTGVLPDIMVVSNREELEKLVKADMIEDLTSAYRNCASKTIMNIYESYDESLMNGVTFNGKIMALPETNIEDGPNLLWLRKDWLDKLKLEVPKTFDDVEKIVKEFVDKDPGRNGLNQTVGLLCDTQLAGECGYSSQFQLDVLFACYGAYPKQWIRNADGKVVYGSVQPEVKKALKKISQLYKSGVIDKNFLLRTTNNMKELVIDGKCGAFFGPWWSPNNPLVDAERKNSAAKWEPYRIATNKDGTTSYYSQNPSYKYVVVRKGYAHPEIAVKIISTLFDYARYQDKNASGIAKYYQLNVDPTARPIAINIDYNDALQRCYKNITDVNVGLLEREDLELLERSYYDSCQNYSKDTKNCAVEDWAAYKSRITACALLSKSKTRKKDSLFFGKTDTMQKEWWKLTDLENRVFLEIVTGEKSVSYFDSFVQKWTKESGEKITGEVRSKVDKQSHFAIQ